MNLNSMQTLSSSQQNWKGYVYFWSIFSSYLLSLWVTSVQAQPSQSLVSISSTQKDFKALLGPFLPVIMIQKFQLSGKVGWPCDQLCFLFIKVHCFVLLFNIWNQLVYNIYLVQLIAYSQNVSLVFVILPDLRAEVCPFLVFDVKL
jgi:hypothetical protein